MEDFVNPNLQLILSIKEGSNFDRVQKSTLILATINTHCLETPVIEPNCNPPYLADLTWDTDKATLRKMRSNQTPVKIECFCISESGYREKIGYLLLTVRCAQIIHRGKESEIKLNWHNLLGVKSEFSSCKPKLLLALFVTERADSISENKSVTDLSSQLDHLNTEPVLLEKECLIQLGPLDKCQDLFLLNITAETAMNFNQIPYINKENDKFNIIYDILNNKITLKTFKLNEINKISLNEKIVIRIRTSLQTLMNYFQFKTHFIILLQKNNVTVAQTIVNLKPLVTTNNLSDFLQINKKGFSSLEQICFFKCSNQFFENRLNFRDDSYGSPNLKINVQLKFMGSKDDDRKMSHSVTDIETSNISVNPGFIPQQKSIYTISNLTKAKYDMTEETDKHFQEQCLIKNCNNTVTLPCECSKNVAHEESLFHQCSKRHDNSETSTYRIYCLNICFQAIQLFNVRSNIKNLEFKFLYNNLDFATVHYTNENITANEKLKLENVESKLLIISSKIGIQNIMKSLKIKAIIYDLCSDHKSTFLGQINFDVEKLISATKKVYNFEAGLMDNNEQNKIGSIEINLSFQDYPLQKTTNGFTEIGEPNIHDHLACDIVNELEYWKEKQEEIFTEELRKKQELHISLLNEEWLRRREFLETKYAQDIEHNKSMAKELHDTIENFKIRKRESLEKETKLIQENEELRLKYDHKVQQLEEGLTKMHGDLSLQIHTLEAQNQALLLQIESLSEKNYELQKMRIEQSEQIETYREISNKKDKNSLHLEEELKNAEKKLIKAEQAKSCFKEKYAKSIRDIHKMSKKTVNLERKSSQEELNNSELEKFLNADNVALTYDKLALNQIKKDIESHADAKSLEEIFYHEKSVPDFSLQQKSSKTDFNKFKFIEKVDADKKHLNYLIEERDSLLRTNSYTEDDEVLIKMNNQIQSLWSKINNFS